MKWVHFVGVCGSAMAPIAVMIRDDLGWFVTGSDKGFFPPFESFLRDSEVKIYPGMKPEHLDRSFYEEQGDTPPEGKQNPDLVVVGNFFSGTTNPELQRAKELNLEVTHYPGVLEKFVVKENSVVITGTAGKTTITGALVHIFKTVGRDTSFMVGGIVNNLSRGVEANNADWSICEGDEPWAAKFEKKSKFFFYHPKYLLITGAAWEHVDMFPTEKDYIKNFQTLMKSMGENGTIIINKDGTNAHSLLKTNTEATIKTYSREEGDFTYTCHSKKVEIRWESEGEEFHHIFSVPLIGDHNKENMAGVFAMGIETGLTPVEIQQGIEKYRGVKRRLEVRYSKDDVKVIDDFGSSPPKAKGSLEAVAKEFPKPAHRIRAIYEPNIGNRTKSSFSLYNNLFDHADEVVIPRLSDAKETKGLKFFNGEKLTKVIGESHLNVKYMPDDNELVAYIVSTSQPGDIVLFMGSHGFRKMIDDVVEQLG